MKANYPNAITRTMLFKLSPAVDAAIEIGSSAITRIRWSC